MAPSLEGIEQPPYDDSRWRRVDLPHTWNRVGNDGLERSVLSNAFRGSGWYRLHFRAPSAPRGNRYFVEFDGVGAVADVWLNGAHLGQHRGAFSRFRFDATAAIRRSAENVLVVEADNSKPEAGARTADVIPLSGDFFIFGGIYRQARLIVTGGVHLDMLDYGGPGLYARAVAIRPEAAEVAVTGRIVNDSATPVSLRVTTAISDRSGHVVASENGPVLTLDAHDASASAHLQIPKPRLWRGTADPYLYRVTMTILSTAGVVLDRVSQPLGLRTVAFDANEGFLLNDGRLALRGASMHQDRPVKGWAISSADQREDFDVLTDLGANAVRLAHYQHDQLSYDLADERGIVVWAEIPLVNQVSLDGSAASAALSANARQQLTELIRQNFNHPSIAVWSIGNEVDLIATLTRGPGRAASLLEALNRLAKSEDPSRATTLADCCEPAPSGAGIDAGDAAQRDVIVGSADTLGYNRYLGWYYGNASGFGAMLDEAHARHPTLPLSVSEYGAGAGLTQHTDDPAGGPIRPHGRPHPEEFQSAYHEMSWAALKERRYLWAVFVWNLFDFASDSRREGDLTDVNDKGLVSYDRRVRKDAFYYYRANWSAQPTLHLAESRYVDRPYGVVDVTAYSNATQATLSVNDVRLGDTPCAAGVCRWRAVQLRSGANELRTEAYVSGKRLRDTVAWTFAGSADVVRIKAGDLGGYMARDGRRYGSDKYFIGGEGLGINPADASGPNRAAVSAADAGLYDSYRHGTFSYRVPVPQGSYHLTLKFQEPTAAASGERRFDVTVNGRTALRAYDVYAAAGGRLRAVDAELDADAPDGQLLIEFQPRTGEAIVSALAISTTNGR